MPVSDIARTEVVTVGRDATVGDAGHRMREGAVGATVVVDDDEPVGIVTDRDVAVHLIDGGDRSDGVAAAMEPEPVAIAADDGVYVATATMAEHGVRRLPVVDDEELVGIVTLDDLVVLLGMELRQLSRTVRSGAPAYGAATTDVYGE